MGCGQRPHLVALRVSRETRCSTNSRAECELAQEVAEVRCICIETSKLLHSHISSSLAITMRISWQLRLPVEFPLCYVVLTMLVGELSCWYGTNRSINGSSTASSIPIREQYGLGDEIDCTVP